MASKLAQRRFRVNPTHGDSHCDVQSGVQSDFQERSICPAVSVFQSPLPRCHCVYGALGHSAVRNDRQSFAGPLFLCLPLVVVVARCVLAPWSRLCYAHSHLHASQTLVEQAILTLSSETYAWLTDGICALDSLAGGHLPVVCHCHIAVLHGICYVGMRMCQVSNPASLTVRHPLTCVACVWDTPMGSTCPPASDKTEVCNFFSKADVNQTDIVANLCVKPELSCTARAHERWEVRGTLRRPPLAALISVRAPPESSATPLRAVVSVMCPS